MSDHDRISENLALKSGTLWRAPSPDLLSQILGLIRLRGEAVMQVAVGTDSTVVLESRAGWFGLIEGGPLQITSDDGQTALAETGDLIVLPRGRGGAIGSGAQQIRTRDLNVGQTDETRLVAGDGAAGRIVLGAFRFEGDGMPSMLAVLPALIHLDTAARSRTGESNWIEGLSVALMAEVEAPGPGATLMISRLIDIFVIRAFRLWVQIAPPERRGWLGALADARISRALKAIHDEPFRQWTVAGLSAMAGMSRSNFAERFAALTGAAPLQYQTRWKLLLAQDLLRQSDTKVGAIARRIGYESEAAFSRAFRSQFGVAPGASRK